MAPPLLLEEIFREEMLPRLPIKSLIRCRCVCKLWNSLFFDTRFARLHYNRSISQNPNDDDYLILINTFHGTSRCVISILSRTNLSETRIQKLPYLLSSNVDDVYLVGSINGLVCIVHLKGVNYYFILWNPATHYFSKPILVPRRCSTIFNYPIPYMFGFGWDSMTNDIKLIANPSSSVVPLRALVYSIKTDSWSKSVDVSKISPLNIYKCSCPCVIVKGIPYWNFPRTSREIIKFDVRTNEFSRMSPFPYFKQSFSLISIDDRLALIEYGSLTSIVYAFNEEANSWSKIHTVHSSILNVPTLMSKYGGEIVFNGSENILYDGKSNQIKSIDYNNRGYSVHGFSYTPSLLTPEGKGM